MNSCTRDFLLSSPADTARLARSLAPLLSAGDVVLLEGPIGAGKSYFARCLILALLPRPEDIPSPTFTLVQTYEASGFDIWHCDLYRLTSPFEAQELGLEDAFENSVCLVEWPDRLGDLAPRDSLTLSLSMTEIPEQRSARFHTSTARFCKYLEQLNV
ncbi:MAG TPA: tRNA (adenosine(37)-N6)-threonylcarbamoyltransferase complex ATPase subunit type 1 TsaE [Rhodobacteraceae bacterium]|nr:tRNA (adenosine(37)-N6)-threonylcarbamoyltransferase complex ATPase subunit type 1 TsaE [Paracoccaceae bacterium]